MDTTKRQRPYLGRACKTMEEVDPALWRKLPMELAYKVLSFLPVDRLVDTLRKVLSHDNPQELFRNHTFSQIFGRGKNLESSYGFVTLSKPYRVLRLSAFEHESMQWREFCEKGHPEVKMSKLIPGGSDGLLLCATCRESRRVIILYTKHNREFVCYSDIGVWNPLLGSVKWLPEHPRISAERPCIDNPHTQMYIVMVDESSKTYKVFASYEDKRLYYSVYDSITGRWRSETFLPDFLIIDRKIQSQTAACDRYVIFDGCDSRRDNVVPGRRTDSEEFICWFDSQTDSWGRAFLSEILADLDSNLKSSLKSGRIESFAILHGVLYMVISICSNGGEVEYTLASLDLSILGHGFAPVFRFEALVPVVDLPMGGSYSFFFNLYTYTLQGKGYVCLRTSLPGKFLQFNVSSGSWLEHNKLLELGKRRWIDGEDCFPFKASLVVP